MKKLLLFALIAITITAFNACSKDNNGDNNWTDDSPIIEFEDPYFEEALLDLNIDKNKDRKISEKEASVIVSLDISWYDDDQVKIRNIDEISYFKALKDLNCCDNQLASLDVNQNIALGYLYCANNQLTSLDVSRATALDWLNCEGNQLTSLKTNTALEYLGCSANPLTSLNVSKNTALKELSCFNNQLTSLDVSKNTALEHLDCSNNQLTSLKTNTALHTLSCSNNQLTSLDVSKNTALETLACNYNQLTSLDVSKCKKLKILYCGENPNLKSIIIYKYHIMEQYCLDAITKEYGDIITYKE